MTDAEKLVELQECYDIVLKTARRVTRDLDHCINWLPSDCEYREMFGERVNHYNLVLGPTQEYRVKLHSEIQRLESELNLLKSYNV